MASVSTNEMKAGTKVLIDGNPFSIVDNEYRKPGKGQATNSLKIRNLRNGRVIDITLKSGDTLEVADVEDVELQYVYNDGEFWTFMDPVSFEQTMVGATQMEEAKLWLKGEETCRIDVWLWRARFFKTRSMAARFIDEGRVRVTRAGQESRLDKPARILKSGDHLVFALGGRLIAVEVQGFGERRGPASEARTLYSALQNSSGAPQGGQP